MPGINATKSTKATPQLSVEASEHSASNSQAGLAVLLIYSVLVLVRVPKILINGRIWAEDGKFLNVAFANSFGSMLAFVHPGMGYRILYQNFAAYLAAHAVPLEFAPYVFSLMGFVLQVLPLVFLYLARRELKLTAPWFGLAAACLLVTTPNYDCWLTTVTAGFLLSASVAAILISPVTERPRKWLARAVLAVAASTGLPSLFLIPFFLYRWIREHERERLIQTLVLLVAALFQVQIMLQGSGGRKFVFSTDAILAAILTNQVLLRIIGYNLLVSAVAFVDSLRTQIEVNQLTGRNYLILLSSASVCLSGLYFMAVRSRRIEALLLVAGGMLMSVLSIVGSLAGIAVITLGSDSRYFYIPNFLISLGMLFAIQPGTSRLPKWGRYITAAIFTWVLAVGAVEYFRFPQYFQDSPPWRDEVAKWRKDPLNPMHIAPRGINILIQPNLNVVSELETLPPNRSVNSMKTFLVLSSGSVVAQRFQASLNGLYEMEIQTVTGGRPAQFHDYPVEWELYEGAAGLSSPLFRGKFEARYAEDWGTVKIDFSHIVNSANRWYEVVFHAAEGIPSNRAIGFAVYTVTPLDVQLKPVTVNKQEAAGSGALRLTVSYAAMR